MMAGPLKAIGKIALSPITAAASLIGKTAPKAPALPVEQPTATRDDAAAQQQAQDALRRRKGSASTMLFGEAGQEAGSTAVKMLTGV